MSNTIITKSEIFENLAIHTYTTNESDHHLSVLEDIDQFKAGKAYSLLELFNCEDPINGWVGKNNAIVAQYEAFNLTGFGCLIKSLINDCKYSKDCIIDNLYKLSVLSTIDNRLNTYTAKFTYIGKQGYETLQICTFDQSQAEKIANTFITFFKYR